MNLLQTSSFIQKIITNNNTPQNKTKRLIDAIYIFIKSSVQFFLEHLQLLMITFILKDLHNIKKLWKFSIG